MGSKHFVDVMGFDDLDGKFLSARDSNTCRFASNGIHVDVRELPDTIRRVLKVLRYNRRDIKVEVSNLFRIQGLSGEGYRSFWAIVNIENGRYKIERGSWGGPSPNDPRNVVDNDDRPRPLPPGAVIIIGEEGGTSPVWAHIIAHPENMKLLAPPPAADLDPREQSALNIIGGLISSYRAEAFQRADLGDYNATNPYVRSLAAKGLIQISGSGIKITTQGKNMRTGAKSLITRSDVEIRGDGNPTGDFYSRNQIRVRPQSNRRALAMQSDLSVRVANRYLKRANMLKVRVPFTVTLKVTRDEIVRGHDGTASTIVINAVLAYSTQSVAIASMWVDYMIQLDDRDVWSVNPASVNVRGSAGAKVTEAVLPFLELFTNSTVARLKREGRLD